MERKNVENILEDYFNSQRSNFIQHLQRQEQNFQDLFNILEDLFSDNSNNNSNKIEQRLKSQKDILEGNMKKENNNFKNKIEQQKKRTNNLLERTNVYIPFTNNIYQNRINRRNHLNNNNLNDARRKQTDKNLEYKKQKAIFSLPCFQYRYIINYEKRQEKNCSICLNDFKPDDDLIRFSCKQHIFHKKCLLTWLEKSNICPLCKKSLLFK